MKHTNLLLLSALLGSSGHAFAQAGEVVCWGYNSYGQCDAPDGVFTQVAAGGEHSLGLREDGTIECWGLNNEGQCDAPKGKFTQVSAGYYHSIGLREDGTVECWGRNNYGQCNHHYK